MAETAKIRLSHVAKAFGDNRVLTDVDLAVTPGESVVLFGTSGSGKTLLLKCILGIVHPDRGSIEVDGRDTVALGSTARAAFMDRFSMLFQQGGLFDSLPVWENVAFKLLTYRHMERTAARRVAEDKLRAVGLRAEVADLYPAELSGGMQKRVGLARAIASAPEIVFLDEPTAGLDPIMSNRISDLIVDVMKGERTTAISITSDMATARRIGDRAAMIHDGRIIWSGPVAELDACDNPHVHQFVHKLAEGPIRMPVRALA
jgi:phospholipid/cholesterol/gamma-HCH transport system ATP-binding protein